MSKVSFVGGGSFGTALAVLLAKKGFECSIWSHRESTVNEINNKRENVKYLKGITIPSNVTAYSNLDEALVGSEVVVLAVPSKAIRELSQKVAPLLTGDEIIVTVAKGIEKHTLKRMSEIIEDEIKNHPIVILSGPSHAEEVARDIPTTVTAASKDVESAKSIQDIFSNNTFRVYTNSDLIGVEIGGAFKNIIALAAGISDGIGYGDNTKAALMTRGMSEIIKVGTKLSGRAETFYGLTGMGDLIVTCTSMHSRNRRAGILIGNGKNVAEAVEEIGMVVEGIEAVKAFYELKLKIDVDMPITTALYQVLFEGKNPNAAVGELMGRKYREEGHEA
ncbi:MAG: NAD(P)H-dependent glycerol-3-phosphate dehydrogenase [Clostridium sp.]|uniref:NAD(P)H-dependent glycerol-3-phosphate dehydrogenase n=1 Tax=Clostridium sp. TaxID=1506 RepID=UPI003047B240